MSRRLGRRSSTLGAAVAGAVLAAAFLGGRALLVRPSAPGDGPPEPTSVTSTTPAARPLASGPIAEQACRVDHEHLVRMWRGTRTGRSAELQVVPEEPNYMNGGLSHNGPFDVYQRVPMFLLGPGHVEAGARPTRPVTMADVAPTIAELIRFDFEAPDGSPLREAIVPAASRRPDPPRLVVTVVWDGGGRYVLERWAEDWPELGALAERGTWYENAVVGSAPSVTSPIHATLGTGAFPRRHGLTDSQVRGPDGRAIDSWSLGPELLLEPALADLFDAAMGNEPKIGVLAQERWHLGMVGHGAGLEGGDRDVAALHSNVVGFAWNNPEEIEDVFTFPGYVNDVGSTDRDMLALDLEDGLADGTWLGHAIAEMGGGFNSPARLPYQTRVLEEIVVREGFGADEVPDLLFVNYKLIDGMAHRYGMNSPEERDTLRATDAQLPELIRFLDRQVGEGNWVLVLTADHGLNPQDPEAFAIGQRRLQAHLQEQFDGDDDDRPVIQKVRPTQIYVDTEELREHGHTLLDVAAFLNRYTKGMNAARPERLDPRERDDPVFRAAYPSRMLADLPCLPEARA
ncbi:MAG: alkaline phosphatase family protein [Actinobacteria bacterium]|nr:alkaline phosphatase family protein [Actinomycetota bacterium]